MAENVFTKGLIIAAPNSGSGKTIFTMGLIGALRARGLSVLAAKTGPDYIDTSFLSVAAGTKALNLDPWAMEKQRLKSLASTHADECELLIVEGVMGLFDGAANGMGSTGDLAASLQFPVIFLVDAARQSQSIAALISGFASWRSDVKIAGIVLNNVASDKHELILRDALNNLDIPLLGVMRRDKELQVPSRHLGLVLANEMPAIQEFSANVAQLIASQCDINEIYSLAAPIIPTSSTSPIPPLGQHIAVARDAAFAFIYQHWLDDWHRAGAELSFFSPLNDEAPAISADAVFLPGGYPELHGEQLANSSTFMEGLKTARDNGALIYGECGGYMVLGKSLTDKAGTTHKMCGLLPHSTAIDSPRRILGYRHLVHNSPLPWSDNLRAHEFHYSSSSSHKVPPLFQAKDAIGTDLAPMGAMAGNVMGSYAHVIDINTSKVSS